MNPDKINELRSIMNKTTICDEHTAHDAIRNKRYIIGSYSNDLGVSFNSDPTLHYIANAARAECMRLAKLYPSKTG